MEGETKKKTAKYNCLSNSNLVPRQTKYFFCSCFYYEKQKGLVETNLLNKGLASADRSNKDYSTTYSTPFIIKVVCNGFIQSIVSIILHSGLVEAKSRSLLAFTAYIVNKQSHKEKALCVPKTN